MGNIKDINAISYKAFSAARFDPDKQCEFEIDLKNLTPAEHALLECVVGEHIEGYQYAWVEYRIDNRLEKPHVHIRLSKDSTVWAAFRMLDNMQVFFLFLLYSLWLGKG